MLTQVRSYQTSDGQLHKEKVSALAHEAHLTVRGIIQGNNLGRMQTMTVSDVSQFIIGHGDELIEVLRKLRDDIRRAPLKKDCGVS